MSLTLVTGKGGVGKTRVSCLLTRQNPLARILETNQDLAEELGKLDLSRNCLQPFSPNESLQDLLTSYIKVKALAKWASRSKLLKNIIHIAPNLEELLQLHHWFKLADVAPTIIDAPSTGNFLSIVKSVKTALNLFDSGHLRGIAEEVETRLIAGTSIRVFIVAQPENSAIEEAKEIESFLRSSYPKIECVKVINRKHPLLPETQNGPWEDFGFVRPQIEAQQIESWKPDLIFNEGAQQWP